MRRNGSNPAEVAHEWLNFCVLMSFGMRIFFSEVTHIAQH